MRKATELILRGASAEDSRFGELRSASAPGETAVEVPDLCTYDVPSVKGMVVKTVQALLKYQPGVDGVRERRLDKGSVGSVMIWENKIGDT